VEPRRNPDRSLYVGLRRGGEHPRACERYGEDAPIGVEGRIVGGDAGRGDGEAPLPGCQLKNPARSVWGAI
jgi:hypothetical protein